MISFDMRTIIFSHVVTDFVCMLVILLLWHQSRKRFAGMGFWFFDFAFQTTAMLLIVSRGSTPNLISVVLSNTLVIGGAILGYIGLGRFVGKKISQIHNYVLLVAFACIQAYFTLVQPSQAARNFNITAALLIIFLQCTWFALYRVDPGMRRLTLGVGLVFGACCLVCIVRMGVLITGSFPANDFFQSGAFESLILISYQVLLILLTYSLVLMLNKRLFSEVKTQEQKFAKAFHSSPYAIMLARLSDGQIAEVNDSFVNIAGYPRAEVMGKTTIDLDLWVKEEDRKAIVNELSTTGKVQGREFEFRKNSGERITGLFSAEIIPFNDQKYVLSSISDISERKRAEEALHASEEKFSKAFGYSPNAITITRLSDGKIIEGNESAYDLFGYSHDEVVGKTTFDLNIWADPADRSRLVKELSAKGFIKNEEFVLQKKDGTHVTVDLSASFVTIGDQKCFLCSFIDITERKRAEEALRRSQEQYSHLVEGSGSVILRADKNMCITFMNEYGLQFFGYSRDELIGKRALGTIIPYKDEEGHDIGAMAEELMHRPDKYTTNIHQNMRKDGSLVWMSWANKAIYDHQGHLVELLAIGNDLSRLREAEKAIRDSEAHYRLLSETAARLLEANDPQRIIEELCREVMEHLGCHTFINFLVDDSTGRLRLNAYAGISEEEARKIDWLDYGVAVCGCVARDRNRIIAEDIFHVPDPRTDLIKSFGIQAYCCHPLMVQGRLIGTLSFGTRTRPNFTPEEVDLMRTVTDQVAIAMQRIETERMLRQHTLKLQNLNETLEQRVKQRTGELATLSAQLVTVQENERKRVSYDLHDHVWQMLLAVRFEIERLFSGEEGRELTLLQSKSEKVSDAMLETVAKIRSMQGDLWPYVLDDIGILATIDWFCREFEKGHSGILIKHRSNLKENELPPSTKIVVYRILQETMSNIAKHSQASRVMLGLMKRDHGFEFTVKDNGVGFDPEGTMIRNAPWGGLGLLTMKARTELSGGNFKIESETGKGTTVRAFWSIQREIEFAKTKD